MNHLNELVQRRGSAPKILLVDDQPAIIHSLIALFDENFEIFFVTSGREAQLKCEEVHPDLVILDFNMPDLSGLEICRLIKDKSSFSEIPVIFLTSSDEEIDEMAGFEAGASDFIHKPVRPAIFRARIVHHLIQKLQTDILRDFAETDGLTGIANRRRFDEQIQKEWAHFIRSQEPLALLIIDVDFFKHFNDCYGHLAGDDCLRKIAVALSTSIMRPHDFVARYGGEEFAVILPRTDSKGALTTATKILAAVQQLNIEHINSEASNKVTVSIGIANASQFLESGSFEQMKAAADNALYNAKRSGRNQAVRYSPGNHPEN